MTTIKEAKVSGHQGGEKKAPAQEKKKRSEKEEKKKEESPQKKKVSIESSVQKKQECKRIAAIQKS